MNNWRTILAIANWPNAENLQLPTRQAGEGLLVVSDNTFALTVPHDAALRRPEGGGRFVSMFVVAGDASAARRAMFREVDGDRGCPMPAFPCELWPGKALPYAAIVAACTSDSRDYSESAAYLFTDGRFVHRKIDSQSLTFFFRERSGAEELPYAVAYALPR